ncbi:MAG: hypothetical protein ABI586_04195 [Candidatus Nanopelagicales bacterium]
MMLSPTVNDEPSPVVDGAVCSPEPYPAGNGLIARQFFIDLDDAHPVAVYRNSQDPGETAQFQLGKGQSQSIYVIAKATSGRHSWSLSLSLIVDGRRVDRKVKASFVTIGASQLPKYWWPRGHGMQMAKRGKWKPAE